MTQSTLKRTLLLSAVVMSCGIAAAQDTSPDTSAMLILDASGSMWGEIDQGGTAQTKIEIARDVIDEMVSTWDKDTPLGLMAYGHRKKGDCSDIEVLLPPAPVDAKAYSKKVRALNPTGKTPMVQSVIEAAEALSYEDKKSTVILVSDGEETCGMDACAMGAALEAKGIDFTAHVIGFDVSLDQSAGMRCLADSTGGIYLDAENAEELSDAITVVSEDTTSAPLEDIVGPATVEVPEEAVIGGTHFKVNWTGPENRRDYLMVTSPDGETQFHRLSIHLVQDREVTLLRAPEAPGVYHVHYMARGGESLAYDEVTVTAAKAFIKAPDEAVTGGTRFTVNVSEPNARQDRLKIFDSEGQQVESRTITLIRKEDGSASLRAPEEAGEYMIKYVTPGGSALAEVPLTVTAAAAIVDAPDAPVIGGTNFPVKVSEPNARQDRLKIFDDKDKQVGSRSISLVRKEDGFASLRAPEEPGDYTVKYVTPDGNVLVEDSLTVIAAAAEIDAPDTPITAGGKFPVKVSAPNARQDRLKVYDQNGKQVSSRTITLVRKKDGIARLNAPEEPGRYTVKYVTPKKNVLAEDTITVVVGITNE